MLKTDWVFLISFIALMVLLVSALLADDSVVYTEFTSPDGTECLIQKLVDRPVWWRFDDTVETITMFCAVKK